MWKIPQSCNVNCWAPGPPAAAVLPPRALPRDCTPGREERRGLISWFSDSEDAWRVGRESLRLGSEAILYSKEIPFHYQSRNRIAAYTFPEQKYSDLFLFDHRFLPLAVFFSFSSTLSQRSYIKEFMKWIFREQR